MGEASRRKRSDTIRRRRFFEENPNCCFCGGEALATTEDHVPNRAIFDERKWPEGYNFPACDMCNQLTRADENILSLVSRISPADDRLSEVRISEIRRAMKGVRNNFPEAFASMRLSANEVRHWLRDRGLKKPPNALLSDIPIVGIDHPQFQQAMKRFGIKLLCALHYKHTGSIAPQDSHVAGHWLSNVQLNDGALSDELLTALGKSAKLMRSKNDLQDQFFYRYAISAERTVTAFLCVFRASFAILGIVSCDDLPSEFDEKLAEGRFRATPFRHQM